MQQDTALKTLRTVGLIIIGYGIVSAAITYISTNQSIDSQLFLLSLGVPAVAIVYPLLIATFFGLLGFGIMRQKKTAYTIFNIIAAILVLLTLLGLLGSIFALTQIDSSTSELSLSGVVTADELRNGYILSIVSSAITVVVLSYCLIKLHPAHIRVALR